MTTKISQNEISSISSAHVTTALGYTPYNATNPSNYQTTSGYTAAANTVTTTNFSISESGGKLIFKYGATTIASMGANGIFISVNNIIAGGTP